MKILVTGANGLIGKHVCQNLYGDNTCQVFGLSRTATSTLYCDKYFCLDISDEKFVECLLRTDEQFDVIIHCAANIHKEHLGSYNMMKINCLGTYNIMNLAVKVKCKVIIFISSIPVIGMPGILPITEITPVNPQSLYHISKVMGELVISQLEKYSIRTVCLRIPSPVGIGMNEKTILPMFIKQALKDQALIIQGKGTRKQNYIDVRDIANAVKKSIYYSSAQGCINIAAEKSISNLELASKCIEIVKSKSEIIFSGHDNLDSLDWKIDINKSRKVLSFSPQYSLDDTILHLAEFYRRNL